MTEHEAETLAYWVRSSGWRGLDPSVKEDSDGMWGVSINGSDPLYYPWEWRFFLDWWNSSRAR